MTSGAGSEQVVGTPLELLNAVESRFGDIDFDLAATAENCVGDRSRFYGPGSALAEDALAEDWEDRDGNLWLNPPFNKIKAWAKKCAETPTGPTTRRIFFLVPLTTANWACDYVHGKALVLGLAPRVKFVGHSTAFPKDLMIAAYGLPPGFEAWQWAPRRRNGGKKSRKKIPDVGVASHGQSRLPNACDVDGAAAIPRSENDGKGTADPDRNAGTAALMNGGRHSMSQPAPIGPEVETTPGEQRRVVGGDDR